HFIRIFDRLQYLLFESRHATIPEEQASIAAIDKSRRVAPPFPAVDPNSSWLAVGESAFGIVACRTGNGSITRKAAVEKQPPPEFDLFRCERTVLRGGKVEIQTQRDRHRGFGKEHHLLLRCKV